MGLIWLYPPSFRKRWKQQLEVVQSEVLANARREGGFAPARARLWMMGDTLRTLPGVWRDALAGERSEGAGLRATIETAWLDVRHGTRLWLKTPGLTACIVGALALGMGGAVAIFSVVYGVLLRPLDYTRPREIAIAPFIPPPVAERLAASPMIRGMEAWHSWRAGLREPDGSIGVRHSAAISPGFFSLLGTSPELGRFIGPVDDAGARWDVIVVSWGAWQRDFGGRPDIIGTGVSIDGQPYTIVGVAPRFFTDPLGFPINDIETTFYRLLRPAERRGPGSFVIRLAPPAAPAMAQRELTSIATTALPPSGPSVNGPRFTVQDVTDARTAGVRPTLYMLSAAAAILLVIGCVNTANLLLARSASRQREILVRAAIGASRRRLLLQFLTESLLLASTAAAIGTWLGYLGVRGILAFADRAIPRASEVALHPVVLAFAAAMTIATAVICGILPALRDSAVALSSRSREIGRGVLGSPGRRLRNGLVIAEVALSVIVASGAGLLVRSLWSLQHVRLGFDADPVLTVRVTFPPKKYSPEKRLRAHEDILAALSGQADVGSAAAVTVHPLSGGGDNIPMWLPGGERPKKGFLLRPVLSDYFTTMGIKVIAGEVATVGDPTRAERVVVLSQKLASQFFGLDNPVGRSLMIDSTPARVTGIVDDVKEFSLDAPDRGTAYMNFTQAPSWMLGPTSTFVLRAPGDGHRLGPAMRAAVTQVDHDLPIAFFRTMRDMQNEQLLAPRLGTMLLVSFGGSAGLLALLGLAGVLAFAVSQRLPEIGVRMALGATQRQVSGGIIREASILIATGLLLGLAGALGTNRLLRTLLFEVGPGDPGVLASIAALTAAMALVASWYPAWRAARVDPLIVLRADS